MTVPWVSREGFGHIDFSFMSRLLGADQEHAIVSRMRETKHAAANMAVSDGKRLDPKLLQQLKAHRWDRTPTKWSQ